jgi:hypothetical protein
MQCKKYENDYVNKITCKIMSFEKPIPFFGTTTFEKKFPEIADISVNIVEIVPDLFNPLEIPAIYSGITKIPPHHPCSDRKCHDGGVDINYILGEMVAKKDRIYDEKRMCHGRIMSPKGRKDYGGCHSDFKIRIEIIYKEDKV